mgnify:CR=1 FL=1
MRWSSSSFFFFNDTATTEIYTLSLHDALPICVELKYADGSMISIDTIAVENEVADNMYERSELDWLIYNAPAEYADLVLNGDPVKYLKTVTVYKPFEN